MGHPLTHYTRCQAAEPELVSVKIREYPIFPLTRLELIMSPATPTAPNRRRILGSTTLGAAAGLITGLAAGVALALPPKSPPVPPKPGRRRFEGKVVAITGATSGIGRAAALAFAAEGGKVAFCGRRTELGAEVERQIKQAGGDALYIKTDVT